METYAWDRFYPNYVSDQTVKMMIEENVSLVQGKGVEKNDLVQALYELDEQQNRDKVLNDLIRDGYQIKESDILDATQWEVGESILKTMLRNFNGHFSEEIVFDFCISGDDIPLLEILKRAPDKLCYSEDQILHIISFVDDVKVLAEIFKRYQPTRIHRNMVIDILESIPDEAYRYVKKYVDMLPFEDRVEIQVDYF